MPIVTIKLHNKQFKLSCNEGQEDNLQKLVDTVNIKLSELKSENPKAPFDMLLVLLLLKLQENVNSLQFRIEKILDENNLIEQEEMSRTLSQVANYLEALAKKMSK